MKLIKCGDYFFEQEKFLKCFRYCTAPTITLDKDAPNFIIYFTESYDPGLGKQVVIEYKDFSKLIKSHKELIDQLMKL